MDDKLKKTLKCMIIGTSIYNVILIVLSIIFLALYYKNKNESNINILILKNEICVLIGYVLSVIGLYSMALSVTKVVNANDPDYAKKHMTLMSSVRFIVFCVLLVVLINKRTFGLSGGIMFALATLGIKFGAYLAPTIENIFNRSIK